MLMFLCEKEKEKYQKRHKHTAIYKHAKTHVMFLKIWNAKFAKTNTQILGKGCNFRARLRPISKRVHFHDYLVGYFYHQNWSSQVFCLWHTLAKNPAIIFELSQREGISSLSKNNLHANHKNANARNLTGTVREMCPYFVL